MGAEKRGQTVESCGRCSLGISSEAAILESLWVKPYKG